MFKSKSHLSQKKSLVTLGQNVLQLQSANKMQQLSKVCPLYLLLNHAFQLAPIRCNQQGIEKTVDLLLLSWNRHVSDETTWHFRTVLKRDL